METSIPPTTHSSIATVNKGGVRVLQSRNAVMLNCTLQPLGTVVDLRLFMPYIGAGGFGMSILPLEGDELLAIFPNGDINAGVALWGLFNGVDKIPEGTSAGLILIEGRPGDNLRVHLRGNASVEIDGNEDTTIHLNEQRVVDLNRTTGIGLNDTRAVGLNDTEVIGGNQKSTIVQNRTATIGLSDTTTVGINRSVTVGVNESTTVGGQRNVTVALNENKFVGAIQTEEVGGIKDLTVGGAHFEVAGGLRLMTVGGLLTINAAGPVTITSLIGIQLAAPAINAVLAGVGERLCNEAFYELVKNHTHPDVDQSEELQDADDVACLTQVFRAQ